jgi:hypothetical protein
MDFDLVIADAFLKVGCKLASYFCLFLQCSFCSLEYNLLACENSPHSVYKVLANVSPRFMPCLRSLTKLMEKLSIGGQWQKSLSIFDSLPVLHLLPNTLLTNAAIVACDIGGQWLRAKVFFESMDRRGLEKDTTTYSSTLSALSNSEDAMMSVPVCFSMRTLLRVQIVVYAARED